MDLEQTAKQLVFLAREDDLSPPDHQRAKALMRELRKMAMTNAQISELTEGRWAETTIKEYTRGVTVMDSQRWQSTTALFGEMVSKGITTGDVKETIAVRDKLEGGGTSLAEIADLLTDLKRAGTDIGGLVVLYREWGTSGLTVSEATSALKYKGEIEGIGFGLDSLSDVAGAAKALGNPRDVLEAIGKYRDVTELDNELKDAQGRLADEETRIKERIEEGEQAIREVEKREESARERLTQIDQQVNAKAQLLRKAEELGKLGLDIERLRQLREVLTEIGAKHGLKGKEAVSKFFDDLKDYEAVLEAEALLQGLQTQIETRKLEAKKWQAEEEAARWKHDDLKETIRAIYALRAKGVKDSQIITWQRILNRFETLEQFDEYLSQYAEVTKLLNARKQETEGYEIRLAKAQSEVETLEKERSKIEAAIDALKVAGIKQLEAMTEAAGKQLKTAAAREIGEMQAVGREVRGQFNSRFAQYDELLEGVSFASQKLERLKQELQKYEGVKKALKSHALASEPEK